MAKLIEQQIFILRGQRVMLISDLAQLYQVQPRALVQAVKRNINRFPEDFMFQLSAEEFRALKSQIVISSWRGMRRANPYAFTEQGVAMLSCVLRSNGRSRSTLRSCEPSFVCAAFLASNAQLALKQVGNSPSRMRKNFRGLPSFYPVDSTVPYPEVAAAFAFGHPQRGVHGDSFSIQSDFPERPTTLHQINVDTIAAPTRTLQNRPFRFGTSHYVKVPGQPAWDFRHAFNLNDAIDIPSSTQPSPKI